MRISPVRTLPQQIYIAFSGGVDSVVLTHKAISQNKNVTLAFFNHGNELAAQEEIFAINFAKEHSLPITIDRCSGEIIGSKEKYWRDRRYEFFKSLKAPVVTGHNLDDALEWYLLSCLRGEGHFMEYQHANVVRPLILTKKENIMGYAADHGLLWFQDPTNNDPEFTYRNKIRKTILPAALEINPGLYTMVANNIRRKIQ